jgi:hypothetical protein
VTIAIYTADVVVFKIFIRPMDEQTSPAPKKVAGVSFAVLLLVPALLTFAKNIKRSLVNLFFLHTFVF